MARRGRSAGDWYELARLPGVRHPKDRRVLEEKVRVPAGLANASAHREFASRPEREGTTSNRTGLEVVRPDEITRTAVAADRRHGDTYRSQEAHFR